MTVFLTQSTKTTDPEVAGKPFSNTIDICSAQCAVSPGNDKLKYSAKNKASQAAEPRAGRSRNTVQARQASGPKKVRKHSQNKIYLHRKMRKSPGQEVEARQPRGECVTSVTTVGASNSTVLESSENQHEAHTHFSHPTRQKELGCLSVSEGEQLKSQIDLTWFLHARGRDCPKQRYLGIGKREVQQAVKARRSR